MPRRLSDERRTASHAQWISCAPGRPRIFCDLLDEVPDVDSRSERAGRKLLDEDRISRARHATREHHSRGCQGRQSKNGADRTASRAVFPDLARWIFQNSRWNERHVAWYRFQRVRARQPRGTFGCWMKNMDGGES